MRRRLLLGALGVALPRRPRAQSAPGMQGAQGAIDALLSPTSFFNPGNARIAEAFAAVAFGGDAGTAAPARTRLQRFRMPMRIGLLGEDAARHAPWVARHAAHLAQLTAQPIAVAGSGEVNVLMLLSPDPGRFLRERPEAATLRRLFGSPAALDGFLAALTPQTGALLTPAFPPTGGHEINGGVVVIPTDRDPAMIWAAIVEELSQLLGLLGDEPGLGWSIFNDQSPYCDLTQLDCWLLRLLYQPGIVPGMGRREAQRAAQEAMRRLRPRDLADGAGHPGLDPGEAAVVEGFLRLAFAAPAAAGSPRTRLARWDAPVRVRVLTDEAATGYANWVGAQVGHLAYLTRHVVELVQDGPANLFVVIADDPAAVLARAESIALLEAALPPLAQAARGLPRLTAAAPCARVAAFADAARTHPRGAVVAIRADVVQPRLWSCIVREMSAAVGMFGQDDAVEGTAFNDRLPHLDLTALDQRLLRLLYLSALRPGQTRAEARDAAMRAVGLSRVAP